MNGELECILGRGGLVLYGMMRCHLGWIDQTDYSMEDKGGKLVGTTICLLPW